MQRHAISLLALWAVLGCSAPTEPSPPAPADRALVASKLAMLGIGVATASEGRGPFDNVLPCPRRGVVSYYNIDAGRNATLHGCDLGDGVVVSGWAEVRWPNPRSRSANIPSIEVAGDLRVTTSDGMESQVTEVKASGFVYTGEQFSEPSPRLIDASAATVNAFGESYDFQVAGSADNVFFPTLSIDALPNTAGLDGLKEDDVRRIALHGGMSLGFLLLNETLEAGRGEHTHTLPCGTLHVVPEGQLVRMEAAWASCDIGQGLIVTGTFTARWSTLTESDMRMVITGEMTVGGGVPRVTLSGMEWNLSGFAEDADRYDLTVAGALSAGTARRTYSFKYTVDD